MEIMARRTLILAFLLTAVVGGAGVQIWKITARADGNDQGTAPAVAVKAKHKPARLPQAVPPPRSGTTAAEARQELIRSNGSPGHALNPLSFANSPLGRPSQPISEPELQLRAAAVEQEANHDLKHLVGLLDLTETQQDRIFDSLVRHAPGWHPAMQAVAIAPVDATAKIPDTSPTPLSPAPAASDTEPTLSDRSKILEAIAVDLTPDQQYDLATAELDRQEWWEEIIPRLLPESDTPSIPGDDGIGIAISAAPPPADDTSGEEPGVLAE